MDLSCSTFLKMLLKFNTLTEVSFLMDNCGFHHGLFVEPVLRELLNDYGVQLIYQPPYCPHLNTCEYCFHQLKEFLRKMSLLVYIYYCDLLIVLPMRELSIFCVIIWLCLTRTGNYQIHEFDWLQWILTAV